MSPIALQILLACHVTSDPPQFIAKPVWDIEAGLDARFMLLREGLLDTRDGNLKITKRGVAWKIPERPRQKD